MLKRLLLAAFAALLPLAASAAVTTTPTIAVYKINDDATGTTWTGGVGYPQTVSVRPWPLKIYPYQATSADALHSQLVMAGLAVGDYQIGLHALEGNGASGGPISITYQYGITVTSGIDLVTTRPALPSVWTTVAVKGGEDVWSPNPPIIVSVPPGVSAPIVAVFVKISPSAFLQDVSYLSPTIITAPMTVTNQGDGVLHHETVTVSGRTATVHMVNLQSTATELATAWNANSSALALAHAVVTPHGFHTPSSVQAANASATMDMPKTGVSQTLTCNVKAEVCNSVAVVGGNAVGIGGVTFTDVPATADGLNAYAGVVSIAYKIGGTAGAETVNVTADGGIVTLKIGTSPASTAGQVAAAFNGNASAAALATATVNRQIGDAMFASQQLAGNISITYVSDQTTRGTEYVTGAGTNFLTVHMLSGASTANDIVTAVNRDVAPSKVSSFVNPNKALLHTPLTPQVTPLSGVIPVDTPQFAPAYGTLSNTGSCAGVNPTLTPVALTPTFGNSDGSSAQVQVGINATFGGVPMWLNLLPAGQVTANPPVAPLQVLDNMSGPGAAWQTTVLTTNFDNPNQGDKGSYDVEYDQAGSNHTGTWGYFDNYTVGPLVGIQQNNWNPLYSGEINFGVPTSPCYGDAQYLGDGQQSITPSLLPSLGTSKLVQVTDHYTYRMANIHATPFWQFDLENALYLNGPATHPSGGNLQIAYMPSSGAYAGVVQGWFSPWEFKTNAQKFEAGCTGTCVLGSDNFIFDEIHQIYTLATPNIAWIVLKWTVNGEDIYQAILQDNPSPPDVSAWHDFITLHMYSNYQSIIPAPGVVDPTWYDVQIHTRLYSAPSGGFQPTTFGSTYTFGTKSLFGTCLQIEVWSPDGGFTSPFTPLAGSTPGC